MNAAEIAGCVEGTDPASLEVLNNYNSMMTAFLSSAAEAAAANIPTSAAHSILQAVKRNSFQLSSVMASPSATNLNSIGSANSNASSGTTSVDGSVNSQMSGCSSVQGGSSQLVYMPVPVNPAASGATAHLFTQLSPQTVRKEPLPQGLPQPRAATYEGAINMIRSPCTAGLSGQITSNDDFCTNTPFSQLSEVTFRGNNLLLAESMGVSQTSTNYQQSSMFPTSFGPKTVSDHQFQVVYAAAAAANALQASQLMATTSNSTVFPNHRNINPLDANNSFNVSENSRRKQPRNSSIQSKSPEYVDKSLPQVPSCSICGAESTGIHFGVEACAACSAFFRRTVVLNKKYGCSKDGQCNFRKDSPTGQKCRACRFTKCLDVGMDRNAVQHRRDAIGKYSSLVKRECASPEIADAEYLPSTSTDYLVKGPTTPKSARLYTPSPIKPGLLPASEVSPATLPLPQGPTILEEITVRYDDMNRRRKIFYSKASLSSLFDDSMELEPVEITDFGECMYQFWRIEPKLAVDFIASNWYLKDIPNEEKGKIFSNFLMSFHAIEEPYITWKHGGLEEGKEFWMMPNKIYLCFNNVEKYFESNSSIMKDLNLDKSSAINLFKPSFEHAMDVVGRKMADMNLSKTEMIALVGIVLLDYTSHSLEQGTRDVLSKLRNQLLKDIMSYYEVDDSMQEPEIRLGNLLLLMSGVKVHAQRSRENMHLLKIFDVVQRDDMFDQVTGIASQTSTPDDTD